MNYLLNLIKNKSYGFYVGVAALIFTIIQLITYSMVPNSLYNWVVILYSVLGIVLFIGCSLYRPISFLAPIFLMIFDFLSLIGFAQGDGIIDYFSTAFFSGVSIDAFFSMDAGVYLSIIFIVLSFIVSSVSVYLRQEKKVKQISEGEVAHEN